MWSLVRLRTHPGPSVCACLSIMMMRSIWSGRGRGELMVCYDVTVHDDWYFIYFTGRDGIKISFFRLASEERESTTVTWRLERCERGRSEEWKWDGCEVGRWDLTLIQPHRPGPVTSVRPVTEAERPDICSKLSAWNIILPQLDPISNDPSLSPVGPKLSLSVSPEINLPHCRVNVKCVSWLVTGVTSDIRLQRLRAPGNPGHGRGGHGRAAQYQHELHVRAVRAAGPAPVLASGWPAMWDALHVPAETEDPGGDIRGQHT